jgi:FemAB-related protein (PEP-CTERM system-associated)
MNPSVRRLEDARQGDWEAYVDTCPTATFFHRAGWRKVLEKAYGHATHYLYAEREGRITGVLPLGHIRSRLFGNALVSTPFCVYGGVAASDESSARVLEDAACDLARELRVDHLELRNREPRNPDWPGKDLYVTFRKSIDPEPDQNLLAVPRKQRAMIRKGIKNGLRSSVDDQIDAFYAIYADSVHRLGTPVFPRRYFRLLKETFGAACEITRVTTLDGRDVSAVLSFRFRDEILPYYGGGLPIARQLAGYDFLYWEVMRRACERGCRVFDYGRSKRGTGSLSFKKNWGFEPEPLHYRFQLVRASSVPDVNPLNPKYRLFIDAWKRMPLWLANALGPMIARDLG